jgi:hypothetical protein
MSEFLYSVYEGFDGQPLMGRARIVKETQKRLYLQVDEGNGGAFRWSSQAPHGRYATSPEDAIERHHEKLRTQIKQYESSIARAMRNLAATPKRIYKETDGNQASMEPAKAPSASAAK